MSARTTAARVAALQNGQYAPGVRECTLPYWRGTDGLLAKNEQWNAVTGVGGWLYYVEDAGALGPLEVLFDTAPPSGVESVTDASSLTDVNAGAPTPNGLVLHPGTFVRMPKEGATLWVRAHAPSIAGSVYSTSVFGAVRAGGSRQARGNIAPADARYLTGRWNVKPRLLTGEDAWLIAQAGEREPSHAVGPGLFASTAYTNVPQGTMFWGHLALPDNGLHSVPCPDVLFPQWMLDRFPRAQAHLSVLCSAQMATASNTDQRVPYLSANGMSLPIGCTLQSAVAESVWDLPTAWNSPSGTAGACIDVAATGRSLSNAGAWYATVRLSKGAPGRAFWGPVPVRSRCFYNSAFSIASGEQRVFAAPGTPSMMWNSRLVVTTLATTAGLQDLMTAPGQGGTGNLGAGSNVLMVDTATAFTNLTNRLTALNGGAGTPLLAHFTSRGSTGTRFIVTTGPLACGLFYSEAYHQDPTV